MKKLGILLCVLVAAAYCQAAEYEIIDLGTLGGDYSDSWVINNAGQVAGDSRTASGESHAFLWTPGDGMIDLGTLGGAYSWARDINSAGQVVGSAQTASGEYHGFLWLPEPAYGLPAGMTDLTALGVSSHPTAINEAGQMVGATATGTHVSLWTPEGGTIDLGTLGGTRSYAGAINEVGQVAGWSTTANGETHAFLWEDLNGNGQSDPDEMVDLGTLGGTVSTARYINNVGQVAGYSHTASGEWHAFLWTPEDGMIDLGTLGGRYSWARDINSAGQVVGHSYTASGENHAFLWTLEEGMIDLGTLGGTDSDTWAINHGGQVAGESATASGDWHAFLWTLEEGMTDLGTLGGAESYTYAMNDAGQVAGGSRTADGEEHACLWQPIVRSPEELILALVDQVEALNLQQGIDNSLDAKLDAALNALDDVNQNNDVAAINTLEAFVNAVEAQRGNKIPEADADALIGAAEEIIFLLMEGM